MVNNKVMFYRSIKFPYMFNKDHHYTIDRTVPKCILIKNSLSWFDLDPEGQGHSKN